LGQILQEVWPEISWYWPSAQASQSMDPQALKRPASQVLQPLEPEVFETVPPGQRSQMAEPEAFAEVPIMQMSHLR